MTSTTTPWDAIQAELTGLETIADAAQLTKLSSDYSHFSPILEAKLKDKRGNLAVRPRTEAEVIQVARTCLKYRVPLTVRGAGTGNYGQCVPLEGGIVLDMTQMNQIRWLKPGLACLQPGVKMAAFDRQAREIGWELRMAPSTYRTATLGGFIAGGSVGMGSINYGQLRDRGNLHAVRAVTLEDEPRVLTLRGDDVQKVSHAYGTNGIITELEIPLAPAYPWAEIIVTFDDFMAAARFGQHLSDSDGIVKKLVSVHAWPIPSYWTALQAFLPAGKHCALLMVSEYCLEPFQDLVREWGGETAYQKSALEASRGTSLLEFTWNHTTLHARNADPTLTYLQTFYGTVDRVGQLQAHFGSEVMVHLEFLRVGGKAIPAGLPLVRFTTEGRLNEIVRYHEEQGAAIANPHTYLLEAGGRSAIDVGQLELKELVDPYGLMNPGKMQAWIERIERGSR